MDVVSRQRELVRRLWMIEAKRAAAENQAEAQRQADQSTADARATKAQEQAHQLLAETHNLRDMANTLARLPTGAFIPDGHVENPLHQMVGSVVLASKTLTRLHDAVVNLNEFRVARQRSRRIVSTIAIVVIIAVVVIVSAYSKTQATVRARGQAQATVQALRLEAPLAFDGVKRNSDWTPLIAEFDGVRMALVPAGCFMMGTADGTDYERPVHQVCLKSPFWLDVTEVTNETFGRLGGVAGHSSYHTGAQQPRDQITWGEASAFCQRRGMRLPTEAEWEYAARGPDGLAYPWGNSFAADNVVCPENSARRSWDVGSKPGGISWVGALDMSGNVWEFVSDWYDARYYSTSPVQDPPGPTRGTVRILRGSSWYGNASDVRATHRDTYWPDHYGAPMGFRCAFSH